jgi:hypothetical protein
MSSEEPRRQPGCPLGTTFYIHIIGFDVSRRKARQKAEGTRVSQPEVEVGEGLKRLKRQYQW